MSRWVFQIFTEHWSVMLPILDLNGWTEFWWVRTHLEYFKAAKLVRNRQTFIKQECIPVGCVLSATVAVCLGEGVCSRGGCLVPGGSAPGGGLWYPCMHWSRPPIWTEWLTDRCKNITLATSLRTVKILPPSPSPPGSSIIEEVTGCIYLVLIRVKGSISLIRYAEMVQSCQLCRVCEWRWYNLVSCAGFVSRDGTILSAVRGLWAEMVQSCQLCGVCERRWYNPVSCVGFVSGDGTILSAVRGLWAEMVQSCQLCGVCERRWYNPVSCAGFVSGDGTILSVVRGLWAEMVQSCQLCGVCERRWYNPVSCAGFVSGDGTILSAVRGLWAEMVQSCQLCGVCEWRWYNPVSCAGFVSGDGTILSAVRGLWAEMVQSCQLCGVCEGRWYNPVSCAGFVSGDGTILSAVLGFVSGDGTILSAVPGLWAEDGRHFSGFIRWKRSRVRFGCLDPVRRFWL